MPSSRATATTSSTSGSVYMASLLLPKASAGRVCHGAPRRRSGRACGTVAAMRIFVLSTRLTDVRAAAFRTLTQSLGDLRFIGPGEPLPDMSEQDAVVVDGPQEPRPLSSLAALRAAVERGASLVVIGGVPTERDGFWAGLLGVIAGPEPPAGEYYARVTSAHSHISDRVTREFAVVDGFVPLIPLADGKVIVDVSVA